MRKKGAQMRELAAKEAEQEKIKNAARPMNQDWFLLYCGKLDNKDTHCAVQHVITFHEMVIEGMVLIDESDCNHYLMVHNMVSPQLAEGEKMMQWKAKAQLSTGTPEHIVTLAADSVLAHSRRRGITQHHTKIMTQEGSTIACVC